MYFRPIQYSDTTRCYTSLVNDTQPVYFGSRYYLIWNNLAINKCNFRKYKEKETADCKHFYPWLFAG